MMNFEKYTNSSKKIINSAQNLALGKKHQKIAPIHILSELLNSNHEIIIKIFQKMGFSRGNEKWGLAVRSRSLSSKNSSGLSAAAGGVWLNPISQNPILYFSIFRCAPVRPIN